MLPEVAVAIAFIAAIHSRDITRALALASNVRCVLVHMLFLTVTHMLVLI